MATGYVVGNLLAPYKGNVSTSVDAESNALAHTAALTAIGGPSASTTIPAETAVTISHPDATGTAVGWFGELLLWDKILIVPSSYAAGFVLSDQVSTFEVWNTYRVAQELVGITVVGDDGVTVTGASLPTPFVGYQARNYTLTVLADGGPYANATITFQFSAFDAAPFIVTGTRLVPFTISPDWTNGVTERFGYLTDVMASHNETEQRILLRSTPTCSIRFTPMAEDARQSGLMQSLLWGWQHRVFGVPWWPYAAQLSSDIAPGSLTIPVDTTYRGYVAGDVVLLWKDPHTWEALTIDTVDVSSLTLQTAIQGTWAAWQTIVLPVKMARIPAKIGANLLTNKMLAGEIEFQVEPTS